MTIKKVKNGCHILIPNYIFPLNRKFCSPVHNLYAMAVFLTLVTFGVIGCIEVLAEFYRDYLFFNWDVPLWYRLSLITDCPLKGLLSSIGPSFFKIIVLFNETRLSGTGPCVLVLKLWCLIFLLLDDNCNYLYIPWPIC